MSIGYRKRGNGWEFRIRYKDPITKKPKEKSRSGFKTKPEARFAAQALEKKLLEGYEQTDLSLSEYLNTWLYEYKEGSVRKNTFELHERNIKVHITPYFQSVDLKDLKPIMYQKFLNRLNANGYSKRTIEIIHSTMYNAFEKAVALGKVEKNPCIGATIKGETKKSDLKFIDSSDISRFLQEAYKYDYIYWIFFKALIETGMRKGEAAALQWSDIDLKNGTIYVNKTLDFKAKTDDGLFGDPKTYNSNRTVKVRKSFVNDLQFHLNYQNQNKTSLNDIYRHDLNLVFCRNDGNFMPKSSLFNAFRKIVDNAKLPTLPIHSLRHTYAVLQLEAGVDMKFIQEQLGHGSIRITSDVYSHISKKIEEMNMAKFEEHTRNIF